MEKIYVYIMSKKMRGITMKKIMSMAVIGLLSMTLLVGCGNKNDQTAGSNNQQNEQTITITHSKGTSTIPAEVKKAVVFELSILDTMDALDVDVEVAAPIDSLPVYLEEYKTSVNAGSIKEPDIEAIYNFNPDVIFISGRQADFYDELNKIAPTVYVEINAATYMEDVKKNVTNVAEIFGKTEAAAEKLAALEEKVNAVKELAQATDDKALIVLTNDGSLSAYGKGSRFGLIHDALGVKEADTTIEVSTHGQEASYEYIAQVNPTILYVVDRTAVSGGTVTGQETLNNELVNSTVAAQTGKVVYLDPECWYLSGGGLTSVQIMVEEIEASLK